MGFMSRISGRLNNNLKASSNKIIGQHKSVLSQYILLLLYFISHLITLHFDQHWKSHHSLRFATLQAGSFLFSAQALLI
jgi:hypothetical protein